MAMNDKQLDEIEMTNEALASEYNIAAGEIIIGTLQHVIITQ